MAPTNTMFWVEYNRSGFTENIAYCKPDFKMSSLLAVAWLLFKVLKLCKRKDTYEMPKKLYKSTVIIYDTLLNTTRIYKRATVVAAADFEIWDSHKEKSRWRNVQLPHTIVHYLLRRSVIVSHWLSYVAVNEQRHNLY